jgi:rod shape-determining protein MreD
MARILFGLVLLFVALVQATILPRINPVSVAPDLVLVLLFVWAASRGTREALAWGFFTGILLDVLAQDPFGTNALALLPVALLAGLAHQRVFHANVLVPIVLVAVATVLRGAILLALRGDMPSGLFIPIQAGLHAVLIPVIYLVLRIFRR